MVASAFLPVAIRGRKLYFLFAKEANDETAPGFSDFGGSVEPSEDVFEAGLREFAEETSGFLGGPEDLRRLIEQRGGVHAFRYTADPKTDYNIHIFNMEYDDHLPLFFNRSLAFVHSNPKISRVLRRTRLFEKGEMAWMSVSEARRRRAEFRPFYRAILDQLLGSELPRIEQFVRSRPRARHGSARRTSRKM
jgi:8-oxo-dGTP pyrophosphatase MutT (NUDIX family)